MNKYSKKLQKIMAETGWTQRELERQTGVSDSTISNLINGITKNISSSTRIKLDRFFAEYKESQQKTVTLPKKIVPLRSRKWSAKKVSLWNRIVAALNYKLF